MPLIYGLLIALAVAGAGVCVGVLITRSRRKRAEPDDEMTKVVPFYTDPYRTSVKPPAPRRNARQMTAVADDDMVLDPNVPALIKRHVPDEETSVMTTPHLEQMRTMLMTHTDDAPRHVHPHTVPHHDHGSSNVCAEAPVHSPSHAGHDVNSPFDHGHCSTDFGGGGFDGGGHHH